jgi:hypothetical protein
MPAPDCLAGAPGLGPGNGGIKIQVVRVIYQSEFRINPIKRLAGISECRDASRTLSRPLSSEGRGHKFRILSGAPDFNDLAKSVTDEPLSRKHHCPGTGTSVLHSVVFAKVKRYAKPLTAAELENDESDRRWQRSGHDSAAARNAREGAHLEFLPAAGYERNPVASRNPTVARLLARPRR